MSALSRNHLLALAAIGLALFVVAIGFAAAKAEVSPTVLVVSALVAAAAGGAVIAAILRAQAVAEPSSPTNGLKRVAGCVNS